MKAYLLHSAKKIEPFGDPPRECLVGNRRLAERQEEILRALEIEPTGVTEISQVDDPNEHLIIGDSLFFSEELIRQFLARSRELRVPTVCCAEPGLSVAATILPTQDVSAKVEPDRIEYALFYRSGDAGLDQPHPVMIAGDQFFDSVRFPEHMVPGGRSTVPLSDTLLLQIDHWANLWAANLALILSGGARLKKAPVAKLLWLALRARSTNQYRVLRQVNRIGRRCDIHPTAYIEGSTVGDNVKIGAGAIVRASMIGDDCYIANNTTVELSVVGAGTTIFNGSVLQYSVLYPSSCISCRYVGMNLSGRNTFISDGVTLSDFRFDGRRVQVVKDGARIDSGQLLLGTCLGHDVYLGAGCILPPGRAVPNGLRIVPESGRLLETFPEGEEIRGYRVVRGNASPDAGRSQ